MEKIKLMQFELVAMLEDSKRLIDFLQKQGVAQLADADHESLVKYRTAPIAAVFEKNKQKIESAVQTLERCCKIKRSIVQQLTDVTEIDYSQYRQITEQADSVMALVYEINALQDEVTAKGTEIIRNQTKIDYYRPWEPLDIPMSTVRTPTTAVFIGLFKSSLSEPQILSLLAQQAPDLDGVSVEVVSSDKLQTCCVALCHLSDASALEQALKAIGFVRPDHPAKTLPKLAIEQLQKENAQARERIAEIEEKIASYGEYYDTIRLLADYEQSQIEKYRFLECAATSQSTIILHGFVPERDAEQLKFDVEQRFVCEMSLEEPDLTDEDVPVLIENHDFAAGVESITNMYSPPSNRDLDPNPVMSFFYYFLFGIMFSDAGYGLLMVIFGIVMKHVIKVQGNLRKTASFALYCGVFTTFWGLMFGSFFGDLIPTICTNFLGIADPPQLALWFEPTSDSIKLMLYSFGFGIIHLFAGLAIRFVTLAKRGDWIGAVCDTIPVYTFVIGLAIVGKDFIEPVSPQLKSIGAKVLLVGAILIVLTAGRSAKNIVGKLGGGLYALYSSTTGYLGDILSYSRLLALCLVTGVIGSVVNMLAAMMGNIVVFVFICILGHSLNIAINLIGTYVHTCRLQYVEYFSKFYEGGGKVFTPLKINLQHFKFKEETINE